MGKERERQSLLIVLSGPSGVGKDAVLSRMKESGLPLHYSVTATTRPCRAGEKSGVDYYFLSEESFQQLREQGGLLEWATVYGHWYGVPRLEIKRAIAQGQDIIIKVDVQGASTIKSLIPQAVLVFLIPPSVEELEQRLRRRGRDSTIDLKLRLGRAREEMKALSSFDYVVVNCQDELDRAVSRIQAIITAERCRVKPRWVELPLKSLQGVATLPLGQDDL